MFRYKCELYQVPKMVKSEQISSRDGRLGSRLSVLTSRSCSIQTQTKIAAFGKSFHGSFLVRNRFTSIGNQNTHFGRCVTALPTIHQAIFTILLNLFPVLFNACRSFSCVLVVLIKLLLRRERL